VREEDAFDVSAVDAWLREQGADVPDGTPQVRQFPGGASNLTYLLSYPSRELILRRPPTGAKAKSAHDMSREYTIQSRLAAAFGLVPDMVAFCGDPDVIGSDFYVMQRLDGTILRRDLPDGMTLGEQDARTLCENFLDVLVRLHRVDPAAAGLESLGRGEGYVARQVGGWSDRYRSARTDNVGDYERVMKWLDEQQPADVATCVIHNDFRLDNVVLAPDNPLEVVGVLDWEMATLGDPLADLGLLVAYWDGLGTSDDPVVAAIGPAAGLPPAADLVARYATRSGRDVPALPWYVAFGFFKIAVILEGIHYRYTHGQTVGAGFDRIGDVVPGLVQDGLAALRSS
jgi:aminoglycoside phosphotransferase (APT) family kinase protein